MANRAMSGDGTALVTGGAGFIGSAIARTLVAEGREVRVFDNFLTGFEENVPAGATMVLGDLRDLDALRAACRGVDVVFHQGAVRSVPRSIDEPVLVEQCNAAGTLHVLVAAEEAGVRRVVYASSSSVYGDSTAPVNQEDMPTDPRSPYAVSKLAGEQYCRVWTRVKGLSTVSLRYFNVFGPGQHPESKYAAVFPAFIKALADGTAPEVHWDGEQSRDFSYIDDVVRANLAAAAADGRADGAVMNVGGGRPKTVNEVLRAVSDAMDTWIEPVTTPMRAGDVRHTRADISRARELLDWEPRADWKDAVEATVRWFRESVSERAAR
ncbi:MAG: NAD-dependent epimerase/dehydratase family protein [Actinomycetota bacterium]|nr:NAD-dependent epimerase/dehydratase family protein [Actinomycetota bacterium]